MKILLYWKTRAGTFYIGQSSNGRFHPIYNGESLGSYANAHQAVDDLAQNATFSVLHADTSAVLDTSELGIPEDPREWERAK
jgi:hypothetical protein